MGTERSRRRRRAGWGVVAWALVGSFAPVGSVAAEPGRTAEPGRDAPVAEEAGHDIVVVTPSGVLHPGRPTTLYVAVAEGGTVAPRVEVSAGALLYEGAHATGIWTWHLVPPVDGGSVEVQVTTEEGGRRVTLPVRLPPPSRLRLPDRIDGAARGGEVRFRVTGEDLPPPEALAVVVGEGRVAGVEAVDGALEVRVQPEDVPFPRAIPVGVRDLRREEQPAWSAIRLRARPTIPLRSEPGSTVVLSVGSRSYGPFVADAEGEVGAWVDQLPGEIVARAVFTDDLGNETHTDLPLAATTQPSLVAFPSGEVVPGVPPPLVWLHALGGEGSRWSGGEPVCRTPTRDLPVHEVERGRWVLSLPEVDREEPDDVRVECALGRSTSTSFRVPAAEGVPARLRMRVWPTDLRADFPSAEVRVVLEDTRGERLPVDGVRVRADRGDVVMEGADGTVARGEYVGSQAVEAGRDVVSAVYEPTATGTFVGRLHLAWDAVPRPGEGERLRVHGRALDPHRRPVPGVGVVLDAGGEAVSATTGPDGWATADVPVPPGRGPLVLRVRHDDREHLRPVQRGAAASGGPGSPDLVDAREVTISPGRVAGISVEVEPSVLRASPGSVAWIKVALEDRSGSAVTDEPVRLEVSEGRVGALKARPDGSFLAEYVPLAVERPREVVVTARTDSLRSSATLRLEPRVVRVSFGPWAGVQTNFGAVTAPIFGLDADLRVRNKVLGESAMLRLGAATYSFTSEADTGMGGTASLGSTVVPLSASFLLREDIGPLGLWAGAGGTVAIHRMELRFDGNPVAVGVRAGGGPNLAGGIARRALGGELVGSVRWTWLPSSGGEFGFTGNIGGLAAGLGYRVVF